MTNGRDDFDSWVLSEDRAKSVRDVLALYALLVERKLGGAGARLIEAIGAPFIQRNAPGIVVDLLRFPYMVAVTLKGFPGTAINGRQRRFAARIFEALRDSRYFGKAKRAAVTSFFRERGWTFTGVERKHVQGILKNDPSLRTCYLRDYKVRRLGARKLAEELTWEGIPGDLRVYYPDDALVHVHHTLSFPAVLPFDPGDPRVRQMEQLVAEASRFSGPLPAEILRSFITRESSWR